MRKPIKIQQGTKRYHLALTGSSSSPCMERQCVLMGKANVMPANLSRPASLRPKQDQ